MLATLIERYDKKLFHFKNVRLTEILKFYRLSGATFYDCINTISQFIKPFCGYSFLISPQKHMLLYSLKEML